MNDDSKIKMQHSCKRPPGDRITLTASSVGIITYNFSGQCISANITAGRILGGTIEQLLKQNFRTIESWVRSGLLDAAEKTLSTGLGQLVEARFTTSFGRNRLFSCRFEVLRHHDSPHLLLIMSDITDHRRMEQSLRESEMRLIQAQILAELGNWEIDLQHMTWRGSEEAYRLHGIEYKGTDAAVMPLAAIYKLVHPEDRPLLDRTLQELLENNKIYDLEFRIIRANDHALRIIHSRADVSFSEEGLPLKVYGTIQDITKFKHVQEALRQSERRFRTLANFLPEAVYEADRQGILTFVNRVWLEHFGYTDEDISRGLNIRNIVIPDDRVPLLAKVHNLFNELNTAPSQYTAQRKDGSTFAAMCHSTIVKHGPAATGLLGIIIDNTEQLRAKESLENAVRKKTEELLIKNAQLVNEINERKRTETALINKTKELAKHATQLQDFNIALKVLVSQREKDKTDLEESILSNIKYLLLPYLEQLKKTRMELESKHLVEIIENNIGEISSAFSQKLTSKYLNLTPTEIRIANLVREGKSIKEIADLMAISHYTVDFHRYNIRKKLGLNRRDMNLRSYLLSLASLGD